MRFTDAHSSSGICTPSRYALLTGRYHWRKFHRIVGSFGASVFDRDRLTLPEMLREKGYRTACIGKWHLGWDWNALRVGGGEPDPKSGYAAEDFDWLRSIPDGPLAHGFDSYFGDDVPNFPPYAWIQDDKVVDMPTVPFHGNVPAAEHFLDSRPGPMVEGWRQDQVMPTLTRKAVEWIRGQEAGDQPFFLYFAWTSPHTPIVPADEFKGMSDAGGYGDYVVESDWSAGEVLKALDESGLSENTIVIFSSDNGPEHIAYDRVRNYRHRSMGPLRGVKRDLWEGGHRVPFIVKWPGMVGADQVSDALTSQIDVMATLATVVGYSLPDDAAEDSFSQLPVWLGDSGAVRNVHVHNTNEDHYAIRQDNWLLIDASTGEIAKSPDWFNEENGYTSNRMDVALFDLTVDVAQRTDLAADHPELVEQMRSQLLKIRGQGHSAPRYER